MAQSLTSSFENFENVGKKVWTFVKYDWQWVQLDYRTVLFLTSKHFCLLKLIKMTWYTFTKYSLLFRIIRVVRNVTFISPYEIQLDELSLYFYFSTRRISQFYCYAIFSIFIMLNWVTVLWHSRKYFFNFPYSRKRERNYFVFISKFTNHSFLNSCLFYFHFQSNFLFISATVLQHKFKLHSNCKKQEKYSVGTTVTKKC